MIKRFTFSALLTMSSLLLVVKAHAQCGWTGWSNTNYPAIPCGSFSSNISVGSGTYTYFTAYQGSNYTVSTCGSSFDTQLTIYDANPAWTVRAYNDDNGPDCGGTNASITWTASFTGDHIAIVNRYNCAQHDFTGTSAILKFRENAPAAPASNPNGGGNVCQGSSIVLNRVSTPPAGLTYHWVNAPGSTTSLGTGSTYSPSTATPGTYNFYVRPRSGSGCWGTASAAVSITVQSNANNPGTISAPASICVGGSASITNVTAATTGSPASSGPNYYYYWQRTSAPVVGWTMYDGPTGNLSSNLPAAVTGTAGTYLLARNSEFGCAGQTSAPFLNFTVNAQAAIPTLNTKTPNVAAICQGQGVNVTINPGSGGGTGAADTYQVSTDGGGSWSGYTSGANINTAAATGSVQVRVSRSAGTGSGCNAVGPVVIATWNVTPQPVIPTLNTKTPNVAAICQGQGVNATINAGSGGTGASDTYEFSTDGGGSWSGYTSGANINTAAATGSVQVRVSRSAGSGTGCNAVGPVVIATWNVTPQPVIPTLNTKTPNVAAICQGQGVNATINAGSGGTGATDTYEFSTNGGGSWSGYTSGANINTAAATGSVQVRVSRSAGSGTGCNAVGPVVIATWNVTPQPVIPTLNTKTPNVAAICQGQGVNATINAGSGGTGAADTYEFSTDGGGSWSGYTSGANINTAAATGSVQVRVSRSAGSGTGCNAVGPVVIATWNVNTLPPAFTVNQVTATPLCFRGTSQIEVPSSTVGLTYQLRDNTTNVGSSQAGTGGTLTFFTNNLTATNANYNVLATNVATCTTAVSAGNITVDAVPVAFANNNDSRTCYINSNDYIEFRSPNGIMMSINSNGQNLGNVTVTEFAGSPVNVQACGTYQPWYVTAALGRHWVVEPEFQPTNPVSVRLYFDNSDYTALQAVANTNSNPNDDIAALGSLDLSKYSNPGNPSVMNGVFTDNCGPGTYSTVYTPTATGTMSGLADLGAFATGQYTQYSFTGFSELWLSGTNNVSPLPIELLSFTASCDNGKVKLNWSTASEINNEKFIIDRSVDLQEWEEVLVQSGSGNSNQQLNYSGIDERPINGLSYYRLTQRDYDGASETFEPISITCYKDVEGNTMMVYPNPATDRYTVSVFVVEDINDATLELLDMNGKRIIIQNISLKKGNNSFVYDTYMLNPGGYMLKVSSSKLELRPAKLIIKQ